jgi:hypothetical protein
MYETQRHIFTNEFDDICILISLDIASVSMKVAISEPNGIWNEIVPASTTNPHHDAGGLCAFEGGL